MTEVVGMHLAAARLLRATGSPLPQMEAWT